MFEQIKTNATKIITATGLALTVGFTNASTQIMQLNVTNPKYTKHYEFGKYEINDDSVSLKMSKIRAFEIALELKGSPYKYVSFSSEKLGAPNKEECVFIPFEQEKLNINKSFFWATITATNIDFSLRKEIEKKNCIALTKKKLGQAIRVGLS